MSVKIVDGNAVDAVLNGKAHVLFHVANCQGVMGSGIAKEIKSKIPSAYIAYKRSIDLYGKGERSLGNFSISGNSNVVNLHAQEFYGYDNKRYISYKALVQSLLSIDDFQLQDVFSDGSLKIAIPYLMGSDRAGGDWDTVLEIVDAIFGHHEILVYKL